MSKPIDRLAFVMAAMLILAACSPAAQPAVMSEGEIQTAIAGTAQALALNLQQAATLAPSPTQPPPTATETAPPTLEPVPTETTPPVALPACIPNPTQYEIGLVTNVVDGDTIDVSIDGQEHRIRYIGMDTPESTTQVEPFGAEASAKNRELVEGQVVTLYKDVSETDRFDRLLRFVFVEDLFVNYELVRQGYATVTTFPPDVACEAFYLEAQQTAVAAATGLWAAPTETPLPTATIQPSSTPVPPTQPPPPTSKPAPTEPPAVDNDCSPAYPDVCIPPPPPDLDCGDIPYRRFKVLPPDPHRFDGRDNDGIGCES